MTIYRRIADGSLRALQVGRSYRIREDHLREYIEENSTRND